MTMEVLFGAIFTVTTPSSEPILIRPFTPVDLSQQPSNMPPEIAGWKHPTISEFNSPFSEFSFGSDSLPNP